MPHKGHLSRAHLRLRAPRSRSVSITPSRGGCTRHYGGTAVGIDLAPAGHAKCEQVWRNWQTYHMNVHGWADIAYTAGFCQHGYTFAGRGFGVRTAANGTNAGNQSWYAFTFIGGGSEVPTTDALDALDWLVQQARASGAGDGFNAHSDHKPTGCPGNFLRGYRLGDRNGAAPSPGTPSPAPAPAPAPPAPPKVNRFGRPLLRVDGSLGEKTIREWQHQMGTEPDGVISRPSNLVRAVQNLCLANGISVGRSGADGKGIIQSPQEPRTDTIGGLQRYLGVGVDRYLSHPESGTVKRLQERLNAGNFR